MVIIHLRILKLRPEVSGCGQLIRNQLSKLCLHSDDEAKHFMHH